MTPRWRRTRRGQVAELNITAFMNLMVVLVPFLLITAVFSRITILELNLPTNAQAGKSPQRTLQLEVIVRANELVVADRSSGPLKRLKAQAGIYPLAELTSYLEKVKQRFPNKQDITLLLEPSVSYDALVQIMDAVRLDANETARAVLFPQISIGDAPRRAG
ncbi:MAG: biopolymer transporter ExbD [Gammaproteobacteria bacterium]|nr:biopolymer transporter ExbD [Gammaproteobacteria bacterium]